MKRDLQASLSFVVKSSAQWNIILLGKGYFEFSFASLEDLRKVRYVEV